VTDRKTAWRYWRRNSSISTFDAIVTGAAGVYAAHRVTKTVPIVAAVPFYLRAVDARVKTLGVDDTLSRLQSRAIAIAPCPIFPAPLSMALL